MTISLAINANVRGQMSIDNLNRSLTRIGSTSRVASAAFRALSAALAGVSFIVVAREAARASDAIRSLNAQLVTTGSSAGLAARQVGIVAQIAQQTGSSYGDVAGVFTRLQSSSRAFGATSAQIATSAAAIQQSFRLSGASTQEAASSAVQLGQALSLGSLQAEELTSILTNNEVLAASIRREFDESNAGLRRLASTGALDAQTVFRAILNDAQNINDQFENFGNLYDQSRIRIQNATTLILGEFGTVVDDVTGINKAIAGLTQSITNAFQDGSLRLSIRRFVNFIDDRFSRVRQIIDNIFSSVGIDIGDELNIGLALFAIGAAPIAAMRVAAVALRTAFAGALGAARLIRGFAGGITRQVERTDLRDDGKALSTSLRGGFDTSPLTPTVKGPPSSETENLGKEARANLVRGFGTTALTATVVGPTATEAMNVGSNVSDNLRSGFGDGVLSSSISSTSDADARMLGESSRTNLVAGFGNGVLTASIVAPRSEAVTAVGDTARMNLNSGFGDGVLTSTVQSDGNSTSVGETTRTDLGSGFGTGILTSSILGPTNAETVGSAAFTNLNSGFGDGSLMTSVAPPLENSASSIGSTVRTELDNGYGDGVLSTSITAPTDAQSIGQTARTSLDAGFGNGILTATIREPSNANDIGMSASTALNNGFGTGILTATVEGPPTDVLSNLGTTANRDLQAGFGDGVLSTSIISTSDATMIGQTANTNLQDGFGTGILTTSIDAPDNATLIGSSLDSDLRSGFGNGVLTTSITNSSDANSIGSALQADLNSGFGTGILTASISAPDNASQIGMELDTSLRNGFGDGVLSTTITSPSAAEAMMIGRNISDNIKEGFGDGVLTTTIQQGTDGPQGQNDTQNNSSGLDATTTAAAGGGVIGARNAQAALPERSLGFGGGGSNLRNFGRVAAGGLLGAGGGAGGVILAQRVNNFFEIDNDSALGVTNQIAGGVVGSVGGEFLQPAVASALTALGTSSVIAIGGLTVAGLTLVDWITQQVNLGVANSSAVDSNELSRQRNFDQQNNALDQGELDAEQARLMQERDALQARLDAILQSLPDVDEAALRVATSEIRGNLERIDGRIRSIERRQDQILNGVVITTDAPGAFAMGGPVEGAGSGTSDSILARISNGEFVVNAQSAAQYLPLLEAINDGTLPRFNQGGQQGFIRSIFSPRRSGNNVESSTSTRDDGPTEAEQQLIDLIAKTEISINENLSDIKAEQEEAQQQIDENQRFDADSSERSYTGQQEDLEINRANLEVQKQQLESLRNPPATAEDRFATVRERAGDVLEFDTDEQMDIRSQISSALSGSISQALMTGDFSMIGEAFLGAVSSALISSIADDLAELLIETALAFNTGGVVPNTAYSTPGVDSVPALLTPGETVIPAGGQLPPGSGGGNSVTVNLEVIGDVTSQTRTEITRMLPQIIDATQSTLVERRVLNNA